MKDDLISREAVLEYLDKRRTYELIDGRNKAYGKGIRDAIKDIEAQPSVPAVPLDILSKKLASNCKPCSLPFISCPDENHDCKICNGRKAWEKVIKKWMEEVREEEPWR